MQEIHQCYLVSCERDTNQKFAATARSVDLFTHYFRGLPQFCPANPQKFQKDPFLIANCERDSICSPVIPPKYSESFQEKVKTFFTSHIHNRKELRYAEK